MESAMTVPATVTMMPMTICGIQYFMPSVMTEKFAIIRARYRANFSI
jgi:hypothetical protein